MESYNIQNLTFTYPGAAAPALSGVTLSITQGEFLTLCGPSGCGKTTLLRQLKPALAPHGAKTGEILFEGAPIDTLPHRKQSAKIGFVLQNPDNQIVTDKVWHELAFGLESLGMETGEIRRRVAEMASFFGIETWFYKDVAELSGGQKQLLSLASIMAMQPSALILDEPTSQLDPIAAADFIATIGRINRELGVTVIMTEHRLEEVFPLTNRAVCMDGGTVICDGTPEHVGRELRGHPMFLAMPAPMRIYAAVPNGLSCPVTVRDGRIWLDDMITSGTEPAPLAPPDKPPTGGVAIELSDVWFRYEKDAPDVIKGLSLRVHDGELLCIVGGNGTGKSTALSIIGAQNKPYRGRVRLYGEEISKIPDDRLFGGEQGGIIGSLPQNPQTLFVKDTVREDLLEALSGRKLSREEIAYNLRRAVKLCRLEELLNMHPYDLSGGEQQRAALAKVLLLTPCILLLDEPTKGLDAEFKRVFASILKKLTDGGMTVIMVSHDVEFCAANAHRCAMFFDGAIVSDGAPREFFAGNSFYTTSANRMARHHLPEAVTARDVITALGGTPKPEAGGGDPGLPDESDTSVLSDDGGADTPTAIDKISLSTRLRSLSPVRKAFAAAALLLLIATAVLIALDAPMFLSFISGGSEAERVAANPGAWRYSALLIALCALVAALAMLVYGGGSAHPRAALKTRVKLPRRTLVALLIVVLLAPLTVIVGMRFLGERKYFFISMLLIFETMLPFILVFEGRRPQAREIVTLSVICALGIAGRVAFFMLPQFKPVTAIAIVAGAAFGCEAGFLVGAMTGLLSGMFFTPGPWTPWQMLAFGLIGFLAGLLFRRGRLARSRTALCVYGGLAAFIIYGGILNSAMVLMYQANPNLKMFLVMILQGIPFDLIHAAATVTFLLLIARPLLTKLERIKLKYGMMGDGS